MVKNRAPQGQRRRRRADTGGERDDGDRAGDGRTRDTPEGAPHVMTAVIEPHGAGALKPAEHERNRLGYWLSTNATSLAPAPAITYCRPSSSYVIGPLVTLLPMRAFQSGSPVVAL